MKRLSIPAFAVGLFFLLTLAFPASGSGISSGRIVFETNHFCGSMDCGRGDIASVNPDGSGLRVLTREAPAVRVSEYSPRWSPDRRRIAYYRPSHIRGQAGGAAQIWLVNADGTHQRALTHLPRSGSIQLYGGDGTLLDWSPDGRQIVFTDNFSGNLYVANVHTGAVRLLKRTGFDSVGWPTWSPDGRWIAFVEEARGQIADTGQIILLSTATHHLHQLTHLAEHQAPGQPAWSPDSRHIAFSSPPGGIHVINVDGTHLHSLKAAGSEPNWSPDGNWIVFAQGNNLAVMKATGFGRHLITHVPINTWQDSDPDW